jgi:hypothetical protein
VVRTHAHHGHDLAVAVARVDELEPTPAQLEELFLGAGLVCHGGHFSITTSWR